MINYSIMGNIIISIGDISKTGGVVMGDEMLLREMGLRVSTRRKELGMTQENVAEAMDVSLQMISNLELGKKAIRPENLIKLTKILQTSADYLLTGIQSQQEVDSISKKLAALPPRQLLALNTLIDTMLEK